MTSTTDTTQHPDVSEIADFTEGILPLPRTAEIRRHLLSCALCEEVRSSLDEIESLLGSLPVPAAMPDDVAARIDAALAAEAVRGPSTAVVTAPEELDVSRETSIGGTEGPTARWPSEPMTAEPMTAAIPAARRKRKGPLTSRSTARPSPASTGPGSRSSTARRRIALGAAFGAGILGVGAFFFQTSGATSGKAASADAASEAVSPNSPPSEAGEFTVATLPEHVRSLLRGVPALRSTEGTETAAQEVEPSGTPLLGDPLEAPSVPACVQRALGRKATVLGVESGEYEGTETYLVVLPHPTDSSLVTAYLVDARCATSDPAGTGSLMFSRPYPRP
ncbi:hypothetical protein [Streptomyces sp. NBC_00102]|uniref:hypothetical protein n=1 Tax=Streptomyces sp. NBC_00102 TaxID=2975652 RepID=UPI0022577A15|nr:hypothetical protein [Streptomyces sp. NBC_00102]MCX5398263.1 hypothetical protein [Streptomyces sp. NBC_00102]